MTTVYADESGTHQGSKILIVSAYIGISKEWESAEIRFRRADKYSDRIFHAVDCAQGGKTFRSMNKAKRYRLFKKMIRIVNDHDLMGISYGAYIEDYDAVYPRNNQHWEEWLKHPFSILFQGLIIDLYRYAEGYYPGEKLSVVYAASQYWYPVAYKSFWELKEQKPYCDGLETIAPYSVKDARQLHAPDLLAYETNLSKSRERYPTGHRPREYMNDLLKKKKLGKMWDKEAFQVLKAVDIASTHEEKEAIVKAFQASRGL
jgi:hypothetical protein